MNDYFGSSKQDAEARAAAAALNAYRRAVLEETGEEFTDSQHLTTNLLTALMHHGDRTDSDFTQALTDAARTHARAIHQEPYPVCAVVDDGKRKGMVTAVNNEVGDEYSYRVKYFGDPTARMRMSGELAPAIFPAVTLSDHKVHTLARAHTELAQLQARLENAKKTHSGAGLREISDHRVLLDAVSDWTSVAPDDVIAELRPRIDTYRNVASTYSATTRPARRGVAELAHADFPTQAPATDTTSRPDPPRPRTGPDAPASGPHARR